MPLTDEQRELMQVMFPAGIEVRHDPEAALKCAVGAFIYVCSLDGREPLPTAEEAREALSGLPTT